MSPFVACWVSFVYSSYAYNVTTVRLYSGGTPSLSAAMSMLGQLLILRVLPGFGPTRGNLRRSCRSGKERIQYHNRTPYDRLPSLIAQGSRSQSQLAW
ncbi:hypothetical protein F4780DRAFT_570987 [Xylariomycetidae sp. FL0641]|nr:hypothetical protein F4780DRAFT_570987 [Xylariomycetidae sp. FL0641]